MFLRSTRFCPLNLKEEILDVLAQLSIILIFIVCDRKHLGNYFLLDTNMNQEIILGSMYLKNPDV